MSDLKEVRHFDVQVSFAKTTAAFNASAGTTARQSPIRQLTGNFAEENEKLATGWSAESSAPQTLRRLILLGFHGSRGVNSATLACRAPLLTQVLNVMTASSLTVLPPLLRAKRTKSLSTVPTSVGKFCANTSKD